MWEKHLWGSQMLGTDRSRSFQKNLILLPSRSSVLVFQPEIYHIGTTQFFWAIIWQVLRAETVKNYTACHSMDAFILIVRARVLNSDIPVYVVWDKYKRFTFSNKLYGLIQEVFSTCWIAYFIILSRHNPCLCIPSTSLKQNTQFQFTKIDIIASSHVWWDKSRQFIWNDLC